MRCYKSNSPGRQLKPQHAGCAVVGMVLGLLFLGDFTVAEIAVTSQNLCATLTVEDLRPFVGSSVGEFREDGSAVQCRWNAGKRPRSVAINITKSTQSAESFWNSNKMVSGGKNSKDEPGIGDHAFSMIATKPNEYPLPGVYFYIIQKNHRLLIVSFQSDGPGTEQMRDEFRLVAKKAASATF